ncbi:uncharacterized protein LOC143080186 [Mytilus galloprovincialis]|uniref:uncharacterized protein LOC143080186 n=1 Tax=Mytilus galloprovincialis TaxID=29158 RepID=UPI003F7C9BE0
MNTFSVIVIVLYFVSIAVSNNLDCQRPSIETPKLYEYILLSDNNICIGNSVTDSITFNVKAKSDAHVALMSSNTDHDPIYEIIIGGWANSRSIIRDSKEGLPLAMHHGALLKQNVYKTFNISWSHGQIRVKDGSEATIMEWTDTTNPLDIRNIGISTWWSSTGNWSFPCQDCQGKEKQYQRNTELQVSDCQGHSIETPNLYKYILLSDNGICIGNQVTDSISFKVKAKSNAHIALMSSNNEQDPLYEIILGGWDNLKSIIRYSKEGLPLAMHRGPVLKPTVYRTFYIKWNNGQIRVEDGSKATIMEWTDTSSSFEIRNIGISTGWGSIGNWSFPCRDCQENDQKIQKNTTLQDCQGPSIETPNLYKYILLSDYGIVIENLVNDSINFKVKASRNVQVALMSSNTDQDPLHEIVLGGWVNSKSVIRDSKEGVALATHGGQVLNQTEYRKFYINWRDGRIRVENGSKATIMEWTDTSSPLKIRNIGISTRGGSTGNWKFSCKGIQEQENIISSKKTEILFILLTVILFVIVTFILGCLFIRHYKRNRVRLPSSKDEVDRGNTNEIYDEIDIALEINVNNSVYLTPPGDDQIGIHEMRDAEQISTSTCKKPIQNIVEQKMRDISMGHRIRSPSPRDQTDTGSTNEVCKENDIALEINVNNSVYISSSGNDQIENREMRDAEQISMPTSMQTIQGIKEHTMSDMSMSVLPETTKHVVSETVQVASEDNLSELNSRRSSLSSESEYDKCFNSISSYI